MKSYPRLSRKLRHIAHVYRNDFNAMHDYISRERHCFDYERSALLSLLHVWARVGAVTQE